MRCFNFFCRSVVLKLKEWSASNVIQRGIFLFLVSPLVFGQMMGSSGVGMIFGVPRGELNFQSSVRTLAMRVNPLEDLGDWYTGPRELEVPTLEWELNQAGSAMMSFEEAQAYAASRAAEGWRLPTLWELEALYRQRDVLNEDFDDGLEESLLANSFWSTTEVMMNISGTLILELNLIMKNVLIMALVS